MDGDSIHITEGHSKGGTYVLRILARRDLTLALGKFKRGRAVTFARGEYLYVGSALAEQGATTLARRLVRHATRSSRRPHHPLRGHLLRRVHELEMMAKDCIVSDEKELRWQVDYLLDHSEVELMGIYALRSPTRIEGKLAKLLENDLATSIVEKGIGASDVPGNTHLLRVDADETWWRLLPLRMQSLATATATSDIVEGYLRGRHCLPLGHDAGERVSFARGTVGHQKISHVSEALGVAVAEIKKDVQFAMAVETLIRNCGDDALTAIFFSQFPQSRKSVEMIARDSDVRQLHRVQGVIKGNFRSIRRQCQDGVFDTTAFGSVLSRLARAEGVLRRLNQRLPVLLETDVQKECFRLIGLCQASARLLRGYLNQDAANEQVIPAKLAKEVVWAGLMDRTITGELAGYARQALHLTIKNVWDYREMRRRGIEPNDEERAKSLCKIEEMLATTKRLMPCLSKQQFC